MRSASPDDVGARHRGAAPDPAPDAASAGAAPPGAGFPISTVAERLGMTQATLRMWQQRYGLGPSRRTVGGHRRYSPADLDRLAAVQQLITQGVATGDAVRAVLAAARHGIPLPPGADPAAHRLCAAALDLDGPAVRELLRDHLRRGSVVDTWERLVRPVLGPIGDRWDRLPHGIAVEHLLSHLVVTAFGEAAAALTRLPAPAEATGLRAPALLASVPGEDHDLPLVALAAALTPHGVTTVLLGASTPGPTLAEAVRRSGAAAVVLYCHVAERAAPALFDGIPPATVRVAAGPGWTGETLAEGVARIDDLEGAVRLLG